MSLSPRTRLGAYEVVSPLGSGGMGEVYRARDTRLGRDVAIKVLPDSLACDPEFRERFEREARAVAALSHPNIVQIHELGADAGHLYAAMELLDGETLRERLAAGPLPLKKSLDYGQQIAHGLAAAHGRGIVHRDLKPENIFVTRDGRVKILDFGIAKVADVRMDAAATGAGTLPAAARTGVGVMLGTVGYMSPEQVRADSVDHRTDVFSFGAVLYEMATGQRAFSGPSSVETLHAILTSDPLDHPAGLPPFAPHALECIVRHCLEKNPDERYQSAKDLAFALQTVSGSSAAGVALPRRTRRGRGLMVAAAAAVLAGVAALLGAYLRAPAPAEAVFFRILPPTDAPIGFPAVSPDGHQIAFLSLSDDWFSGDAIWIRRPDSLDAQKLEGTGGARAPFWSPDGRSLGFFTAGRLKTIEVETGRVTVVCGAASGFGGAWGPDGTILFSADERSPILRVSASGGTPAPVTTIDRGAGEEAHRWPQFLPDGRHFVYAAWNSTSTIRPIRIASLDSEPVRTLFTSSSGVVVAGNYVIFASEQPARLNAWAYDAGKRSMIGEPMQILADTNVEYVWATADPAASAAADTLVYTTGKYRRSRLTWFDRLGKPLGTVGETATYFDPALTRDGRHLAIEKHDVDRNSGDVWGVDLERGVFSRLTSAPGFENVAVWSPDGTRVAFASDQEKTARVYVRDGGGAGAERAIFDGRAFPLDWSADGRHLLLLTAAGNTGLDVTAYDTETRRTAPLLSTPFDEYGATFSPNGRWIAYASNESKLRQVYIRAFPDTSIRIAVSTGGGAQPQWRRDGRELFYLAPDNTLMAVDIDTSGGHLRAGTPTPLFVANVDQRKVLRNNYAASPDGQRFLVVTSADREISPLVTVLNWRSLLKDLR